MQGRGYCFVFDVYRSSPPYEAEHAIVVPVRRAVCILGVLRGVILSCSRLKSGGMILNIIVFFAQGELTGREVSLHNQKLALESVVKELQDTKQTIDRFRCGWFLIGSSLQATDHACSNSP